MDHSELLQKLPGSVYKKDSQSGAGKFWSLPASQANELEVSIIPAYDLENQVGVQLDKIGMLHGVKRLGVSDSLYRSKILNSPINQFITIPALKELLYQYTNNPIIREMCYADRYEWETFDGSDFLNSVGTFEPAMRIANELFLDGNGTFDRLDILDPTKSPSQNLKKNISQRSGKFLKNVRIPTETVVLKVFSRRLRL
ncbi:hypothetical protein [Leptospira borgpetersenii]|uniref:hypothetical protein n=1 Tax=Leptospira borgpetersenii TaxID=174 RepID=UPI001E48B8C7|nr:hypothetical protein [Leptospira borgpetersenii]